MRSTIAELKLLGIKAGQSPRHSKLDLSVSEEGVNIRDRKTNQELLSLVCDDHGFVLLKGHPAVLAEIRMFHGNDESALREIVGKVFTGPRLHALEPRPGVNSDSSFRAGEDCTLIFRGSIFRYDHTSQELTMQNGLRQKIVRLKTPEVVRNKDSKLMVVSDAMVASGPSQPLQIAEPVSDVTGGENPNKIKDPDQTRELEVVDKAAVVDRAA